MGQPLRLRPACGRPFFVRNLHDKKNQAHPRHWPIWLGPPQPSIGQPANGRWVAREGSSGISWRSSTSSSHTPFSAQLEGLSAGKAVPLAGASIAAHTVSWQGEGGEGQPTDEAGKFRRSMSDHFSVARGVPRECPAAPHAGANAGASYQRRHSRSHLSATLPSTACAHALLAGVAHT